jgi:glycosyltransferase involved in cell wall biosynthesis
VTEELMRVLMVSYAYPPFLQMGGPPRKVAALARELARRGHRVDVLTANHELRRGTLREDRDGVSVHYLRSIARYRNTVTLNPGLFVEGHRRVKNADVVHVFGLHDLLGPVAARAAHRAGVPYVVEPLGMYRPIVRSLRKKRLYHALLGRRLTSKAARVIATSTLERDDLVFDGVPPEHIVVRPNGLDLEEFRELPSRGTFRGRQGTPSHVPLILFLGRLTPVKRPELVIDALAMQTDTSAQAVFVGPDEDGTRAKLERRAADRGVGHRVVCTGPMYGREKLEVLVDADVLALPSESENFGNVALEALACGLPVVLSDRCGFAPEVDGRAGYAVPPEPTLLAEALGRVLGDRGMRERVARVGPAIAARYSWENVGAQMEEIYQAVLAGSRR